MITRMLIACGCGATPSVRRCIPFVRVQTSRQDRDTVHWWSPWLLFGPGSKAGVEGSMTGFCMEVVASSRSVSGEIVTWSPTAADHTRLSQEAEKVSFTTFVLTTDTIMQTRCRLFLQTQDEQMWRAASDETERHSLALTLPRDRVGEFI